MMGLAEFLRSLAEKMNGLAEFRTKSAESFHIILRITLEMMSLAEFLCNLAE